MLGASQAEHSLYSPLQAQGTRTNKTMATTELLKWQKPRKAQTSQTGTSHSRA